MSKTSPRVSVIIPAFNAQNVIAESLKSILNQTYGAIECIVIDDCSTDRTWQILQEFAASDTRVRIYQNQNNLGVGGNRNKGIGLAKGEFICWQDADDIALPDRIALQLRYLQENPQVGVVGGYLQFFGTNVKESIRKYPEHDRELRKIIFKFNPIAQPAMMCRAECFRAVGLYNEKYRVDEDLDMLFRLGEKYEFANVQQVVIRYRQDEKSLTGANLKHMELMTIRLRKLYAGSPAYKPTMFDYAYNLVQYLSIFIIPPKLKIRLFNLLRNTA